MGSMVEVIVDQAIKIAQITTEDIMNAERVTRTALIPITPKVRKPASQAIKTVEVQISLTGKIVIVDQETKTAPTTTTQMLRPSKVVEEILRV